MLGSSGVSSPEEDPPQQISPGQRNIIISKDSFVDKKFS